MLLINPILLPKYSPVVIEKMRNRHKDVHPEMTCTIHKKYWKHISFLIGEVMDVRTLDGLDCSSFDVAIDKGTP